MGLLRFLFGGGEEKKEGVGITAPSVVEGYAKTDSGLEYADLKAGEGATVEKGQQVTVHYSGWLKSGKRFDSSVVKKKPFTFTVGARKVIKGWDEGVVAMKVGGVRQLRVPANLAYGPMGRPPRIPKNATLVFEIEVLSVA